MSHAFCAASRYGASTFCSASASAPFASAAGAALRAGALAEADADALAAAPEGRTGGEGRSEVGACCSALAPSAALWPRPSDVSSAHSSVAGGGGVRGA